jgi:hypothetical protein
MMPEQNEKVAEWNEQLATDAERMRSEHARSEQEVPDQTRSEPTMQSEQQTRSEPTMQSDQQTRSDHGTSADSRSEQAAADETHETRTDRMDSGQTGSTPMGSAQTGSGQAASAQMGSGQAASAQTGSGHTAQADGEQRERLVPEDRAASYGQRWDAVKGTFVDEPREAVAQADALVGELLDELETLFHEQRRSIEHGLDTDETSTEDLRLALRRYRSFFERLLAV